MGWRASVASLNRPPLFSMAGGEKLDYGYGSRDDAGGEDAGASSAIDRFRRALQGVDRNRDLFSTCFRNEYTSFLFWLSVFAKVIANSSFALAESSVFSSVCQASVALGALWRTSEAPSERSIQNSASLCDEAFVVGGGGAVVNGAHRVEPLKKCDGGREVGSCSAC